MTTTARPLRIALVSAFPPARQSLNEYGLHLARGLADHDQIAEVVVLADRKDTGLAELDLGPKVRVRRVWSFNAATTFVSIASALREERVDGALFNIQMATFGDREIPAALGLMSPLAARLTGTPAGVLAHNLIGGIDLDETHLKGQRLRQNIIRIGGAIVTRALLAANYMTVTLDGYHQMLKRRYPTADVALVPHGAFDTGPVEVVPNAKRAMRIVTMGKFGTYKRLETLLAAFELLRDVPGLEDLELVIGGSDHPSTPGYMESCSRQAKNNPRVTFAGYLPEEDIPSFFGQARVSVFDYSATTGSSGVLHQTASYGTVPLFPRIGDFVDLCRDEGIEGMHYAPGDAPGMAEAIRSLLFDPERSDAMAARNLEAARGMPFSDVVEYHIRRFRSLRKRPGQAADVTKSLAQR